MEEENVMIYGVKSDDKFKYIGKTSSSVCVDGQIKNTGIRAQYNNKPLRDVFVNYENVSVEPIILVPESEWYPEKLREVLQHNDHPLVNAQWMLEGKRGYWQDKKRDQHTLQMLSQSKFKKYVEYDKNGKLKKIWSGGKTIGTEVFGDYHVSKFCGKTMFYNVVKRSRIEDRLSHGSYWFTFEELITHFNGIPNKINIEKIIKTEAENRRLRRILNYKKGVQKKVRRYQIECYERNTGKLITTYKNSFEAAHNLCTTSDVIRKICAGMIKPARDFILKYGAKTLQDMNENIYENDEYSYHTIKPLPRVEIDTESRKAKEKERQRIEAERLKAEEKERQRLLEIQRKIDERKQLLLEEKLRIEEKLRLLDEPNVDLLDANLFNTNTNVNANVVIADIDYVSVRTLNCLRYANIKTLGELSMYDERHLLYIRNFGRKCLVEIKEILEEYNMCLAEKMVK